MATRTRHLLEEAVYRHNHVVSSSIVWSTTQCTAIWLHVSRNVWCFCKKGLMTKSALSVLIEMLKYESWDIIINRTDVNDSFNLFNNNNIY